MLFKGNPNMQQKNENMFQTKILLHYDIKTNNYSLKLFVPIHRNPFMYLSGMGVEV